MYPIDTSLSSAALGAVYAQSQIRSALNSGLERLYTGYRINQASDDPTGMVDAVRIGKRIASGEAAFKNNQASLSALGEIDSTLRLMLDQLLQARDVIQESINESNPTRQQTFLDQVTTLIENYDQHARTATVGRTAVLAGEALISLGSQAGDLLDTSRSHVRKATRDYSLHIQFQSADAAEQAFVRETYNPAWAGTDAVIRITTDEGAQSVTIPNGTGANAAAGLIHATIAEIGGYAVEDGGDIVIATSDYGDARSIAYESLSGPDIFPAAAPPVSDTGKDGAVNINGKQFALAGDLSVTFSDTLFSASLAFAADKTALDPVSGASPADATLSLAPSGGLYLHFGPNGTALDGARFGFRDLTAEALGLDAITQSGDPNDMLTNPDGAIDVVMAAYDTLRRTAGALGATMGDELQTMSSHLQNMLQELYDRQSELMDTDVAYETARVAKMQLLQEAGVNAIRVDVSTRQTLLKLFDVSA